MKKTLIILGSIIIFFGLAYVALFLYINSRTAPADIGTSPDVKNNMIYAIGDKYFLMVNGRAQENNDALTMFGEPVYGDLNGDGKQDAAVLLVNEPGGSGTFYYAVLAINVSYGIYQEPRYEATNALLLGDRIAPQTIEIHDGQAVYNYAARLPNKPMTAQPSVGKSFYVQYNQDTRQISELVKTNTMTEAEARVIAEETCIKGGESLSAGTYNDNSKTWWYDANLNATRAGCNPACVVSVETKTAEINWRCTGAIKPGTACPQDAKLCPDGSYVSRTGPNCEFADCSN